MNVKATNTTLTPQISDYLNKKIDSLKKLMGQDEPAAICDVEVGKTTQHHKTGDIFRAEINLQVGGKQFYASSETGDLYASIDEVKDEIKNRLLTHKTKKQTLIRKGGAQIKSMLRNFRFRKK